MINIVHDLTIKPGEAKHGTKKVITRRNKRLEVTVPPGVKNGTLIKLSGALEITDGYYGDIYVQIHIDNKFSNIWAISAYAAFALAIILIVVFTSVLNNPAEPKATPTTVPSVTMGATLAPTIPHPHFTNNATVSSGYLTVFHGEQPDDFPNRGKPVHLTENASATDVTWKELKAFLLLDKTDRTPYIEYLYECASFAEELHNNAEAKGIRSAFVALLFPETNTGHALNAFHTTDKGLVYIDCSVGTDAVAYVVEDKEYGLVPLQMASSFDYTVYTKYKRANKYNLNFINDISLVVDLLFVYW